MDGIYFVMNQMVIKNIPQSGLFLTVEYCVDSVENFHTLLVTILFSATTILSAVFQPIK